MSCVAVACQAGGKIEVAPDEIVLIALDEQGTLQPTVRNDKGRRLKVTPRDLSWSSSDDKVITVDRDGVVTAVGYGNAEVSVSLGMRTGTARVRVTKPARVDIEPATLELFAAGPPVPLKATVHDETGAEIPTRIIAWASKDTQIVRVELGEAQGLNVGTTKVTARCGDAVGEATAKVSYPVIARLALDETDFDLDAGDDLLLAVYAFSKEDKPLRLVKLDYKSSKPKVASVNADGVVTARRPGTAVITVSGSGQSVRAKVRVHR